MRFTRRALFGSLLLGSRSARAFSTDGFPERAIRFNEHWGRFFRAYLGCPKDATDAQQCNPKLGTLDYTEFNKAAKEARSLFSLESK